MFIDVEFKHPFDKSKGTVKYQKKLPESLENQIREFVEIISKNNSMLIVPVNVKIIDNDKMFSTTMFISTMVESSCRLTINDTGKKEEIQSDGRIKRWAKIEELNKYLRIILLEDGETLHNAFFDRSYKK